MDSFSFVHVRQATIDLLRRQFLKSNIWDYKYSGVAPVLDDKYASSLFLRLVDEIILARKYSGELF